jgi:hypothetical protein
MGVSLADDEQRQGRDKAGQQDAEEERQRPQEAEEWRWRRKWRRRRWWSSGGGWWRLCRDDVRVPTSLSHFLDMERRLTGAGLLCGGDGGDGERDVVTTSPLLEDGRAVGVAGGERGKWKLRRLAQGSSSSLTRLPVLLTAICNGGAG